MSILVNEFMEKSNEMSRFDCIEDTNLNDGMYEFRTKLCDAVMQFMEKHYILVPIYVSDERIAYIKIPEKHMFFVLREYLFNGNGTGINITMIAPIINAKGEAFYDYPMLRKIPNAFMKNDYDKLLRNICNSLIRMNLQYNKHCDSYLTKDIICNYIRETVMNQEDMDYKNIFCHNFLPRIHFCKEKTTIYLLDRDNILISERHIHPDMDLREGSTYKNMIDMHSILLKYVNEIDLPVFTISSEIDHAVIRRVIDVSGGGDSMVINMKYISNSDIYKSCRLLYRNDIKNEVINDLVLIHDLQNHMKNDEAECPDHPPEYDLPVPLLPELIKLGKAFSTSPYSGKVFITEFNGMIRRFI